MWRRVRVSVIGCVVLAALASLAGCGRNFFGGEREAWRHEAEVACLKSGAVKEGPTQVRIEPIRGPGMCGADFPLKVEAFAGDRQVYGFADELRPPAGIPNGSQPRWPVSEPRYPLLSKPSSYPQSPQPQYPQPPSQSQPQYAAPQATPSYPSRALPPPETQQYQPRGAPRVGAPEPGNAPMMITPQGAERQGVERQGVERQVLAPPAYGSRAPAYPQTAYPQRPSNTQYVPGPQVSEDDEDDVPDDAIRPSQQPRAPQRNAPLPRATPVPLGTRPDLVTGSVGPVEVKPAATLACPIVSALDQWIINAVQPAAKKWLGQPVVEIKQISAYSCRGMNGQVGARISEHAFGNALDIAAFVLADGRKLTVKDGWYGMPEEQGFLRDVQGAACEQFTTVLAPGSNRFHYDHIHVDLMRRSSGRAACNPHAIPGEVAAERAKQRGNNWARKGGDAGITGSIGARKSAKLPLLFGPSKGDEASDDEEGVTDE